MQFRDHHKDFVKAGAVVFGVSRDNMTSHEKFKQQPRTALRADRRHRREAVPHVRRGQEQDHVRQEGQGHRAQHLPDRRRTACCAPNGAASRSPAMSTRCSRPSSAEEGRLTRLCSSVATVALACIIAMPVQRDAPPKAAQPTVRLFCFSTPPTHPMPLPKPPAKQSRPARPRRLRVPGRAPDPTSAPPKPHAARRAGAPAAARPVRQPRGAAGAAAGAAARRRRTAAPPRAPPAAPQRRAAQAARHRPGQAVRARHQRADARPDVAVPLRRARHLPADDHAGGTGQPQEGHERSRAQRAPGQPRPRRAGRRSPTPRASVDATAGIAAVQAPATARPAASCSSRPRCSTSSCPPACRRARPTTRSSAWCRRCASSSPGATWCWCPRTSTCASRRARSACRPRTTSTTRRSTTATCSTPACCRCRPTSGTRHGKTMESWQQGGHTFYRISGPLVPALLINQFVYLEAPGAAPLYAASPRSPARPRC